MYGVSFKIKEVILMLLEMIMSCVVRNNFDIVILVVFKCSNNDIDFWIKVFHTIPELRSGGRYENRGATYMLDVIQCSDNQNFALGGKDDSG